MDPLPDVVVYTDGACQGNPGPGGYGVVLTAGGLRREIAGGFRRTTNNRMELMAAIVALRSLKKRGRVILHTDSQYVAQAINEGWAARWRDAGWWLTPNKPAKNPDLWAELLALVEAHAVTVSWVRGHAGVAENERTDALAVEAAAKPDLPPDEFFERTEREPPPASIPVGHPCFKCKTPLVKRMSQGKLKPGQAYYFEWYLLCPACKATVLVEEAKRFPAPAPELGF